MDTDGHLYYQRGDSPKHLLIPMGDDLFSVGDLDFFRLTFGRTDQGAVNVIIGLYDNGRRDQHKRIES